MTPTANYLTATNHRTTHRRGRWGRAYCARNRRGASRFWRGDSSASFITWVRGFLTKVHVVSKRLLVVQELKPKTPHGAPQASLGTGHGIDIATARSTAHVESYASNALLLCGFRLHGSEQWTTSDASHTEEGEISRRVLVLKRSRWLDFRGCKIPQSSSVKAIFCLSSRLVAVEVKRKGLEV